MTSSLAKHHGTSICWCLAKSSLNANTMLNSGRRLGYVAKKIEQIGIRVSSELKEQADRVAHEHRRSTSAWVRLLIEEALGQADARPAISAEDERVLRIVHEIRKTGEEPERLAIRLLRHVARGGLFLRAIRAFEALLTDLNNHRRGS